MNTSTVHPTSDEAAPHAVTVAPNFLGGNQPVDLPVDPSGTDDTDTSAALDSARPTAPSALGIVLGTREIGYAVTSGAHLHAFGVLNINKLVSSESKESRFRSLVLNYLDIPAVTRVALVEPYPGIAGDALIASLITWLGDISRQKNRTVEVCRYTSVMRTFGTDVQRATHRTLCTTLASRFPVLQRFTPEAELPVRGHLIPDFLAQKLPRFASPRERYWQRAFLALGTALHAVENDSTPPANQHGA